MAEARDPEKFGMSEDGWATYDDERLCPPGWHPEEWRPGYWVLVRDQCR